MGLSEAAANMSAQSVAKMLDGGYLRIYAASGTMLAELRYPSPAFSDAINGKVMGNKIIPESDAKAGGKPATFTAFTADGTEVFSGKIGQHMTLNQDKIQRHTEVAITSHSLTHKMED